MTKRLALDKEDKKGDESVVTKATDEEIHKFLKEHEAWSLVDDKLHREFVFKDFVEAFDFMTQAALVAEEMDHHPPPLVDRSSMAPPPPPLSSVLGFCCWSSDSCFLIFFEGDLRRLLLLLLVRVNLLLLDLTLHSLTHSLTHFWERWL